ncbi:MAG: response regulator transcription factor, partial [Chloroflexota bacterium]|nr:response regulator transcription factor [Chloroflexota bacterium]
VRAVLRRAQGNLRQPVIIHAGSLEVDIESHVVTRAGEKIHLTRSEFKLLAALVQHPGQVFTREQLVEHLHGVAYAGYDRSVDSHIKNLRQKIEDDPTVPAYIQTIYGVGYKFRGEIK